MCPVLLSDEDMKIRTNLLNGTVRIKEAVPCYYCELCGFSMLTSQCFDHIVVRQVLRSTCAEKQFRLMAGERSVN